MALIENNLLNEELQTPDYEQEESDNVAVPTGVKPVPIYKKEPVGNEKPQIASYDTSLETKLKKGTFNNSVVNKLHLIKLANDYPAMEKGIKTHKDLFKLRTVSDLCQMDTVAMTYDIDDFMYCKNLGYPINRLITLRRYPYPCTDNIWDKESQGEPDISRMVTYFNQETNKLDEILQFSYALKWKELTAEMEQASMQGNDQSGLSGFMKKAAQFIDPALWKNKLRGENANMLDPKYDQNKVYGPVDSITNTNIRDVGFDFTKEFEIVFEYELRSVNGRTPEYAMKDIIANILACTYNNGKFWPGSRYWIGERPSKFMNTFKWMNSDNIDTILGGAAKSLKSALKSISTKSSAIAVLKEAMTGGFAMALGKILDTVGRPGIMTTNSLLSGEPTGLWHLTIGNPVNPIMCIGNLICTGVDFNFPSDSLSYGDFPTKMVAKVKLKPGQAKDRAGIEMMFNMGKHRMYYAPKHVKTQKGNSKRIARKVRNFYNSDYNGVKTTTKDIDCMLKQTYDFVSEGVLSVEETDKSTAAASATTDKTGNDSSLTAENNTTINANANQEILNSNLA